MLVVHIVFLIRLFRRHCTVRLYDAGVRGHTLPPERDGDLDGQVATGLREDEYFRIAYTLTN